MTRLSINILHGNVKADDRERAQAAAAAFLAERNVTPSAAEAEFQRQWAWLETDEAAAQGKSQDYVCLEGLAAEWVEAEAAANIALTEGWHDPDGASCTISA